MTKIGRSLTFMIIGLFFFAACSASQDRRVAPTLATAAAWNLTFHLSGGFAGLDRELKLASTGALTAADRRRSMEVMRLAGANELDPIAALVAELKSFDVAPDRDCRDCLEYDLAVQIDDRSFAWRLNDVSLAGTGIEKLVSALTGLLNRALAGEVKD